MPETKRILYLDNIRWVMIAFVVLMHLNVTYGGMGSWYYKEPRTLDPFSFVVFGMYGALIQAFFMGILFFIAGYFAAPSLDRKGTGKFIRDRLFRLGVPTLVFMLIISPITVFLVTPFSLNDYLSYITSLEFLSGSGPLWFALALLVFSVVYALLKLAFHDEEKKVTITHGKIVGVIVLMAVFSFLLRIVFPSGANSFSIFNMQLGNFSSYIVMFILGIIAFRKDLLSKLCYKFGIFWFRLALYIGILAWMIMMLLGGAIENSAPFFGGLNWQNLLYSFWESFFCVSICIGLLALFKERYNIKGRLAGFLCSNAFGVYVFHAPILVGLSLLFKGVVMYPLLKMVVMAVIVIPACFIASYLIRQIPGMKRVFS